MKTLMQAAFAAGALCMAASVAMADPAVVYDAGGKFDKSFNEAAYNGIEKFKKDTGSSYLEFEVQADAQREQAFRKMAQRGADPIIGIGFSQESAIKKVAPEFPKIRFVIIDSVVDLPNVQSIVFKEQEGSVPGRRARRARQQVGQGRLRRRHGHSADQPLPVRLRPGREGGQCRVSKCWRT